MANPNYKHVHSWVPVTQTIYHPAVTHEEDVYESHATIILGAGRGEYLYTMKHCNGNDVCGCGYETTNGEEMDIHMAENGHSCSSWEVHADIPNETIVENVKVGTQTITDQEAWTETIITGQVCSTCGATQ